MTPEYIGYVQQRASSLCSSLIICPLDVPERININIRKGLVESEAEKVVSCCSKKLVSSLTPTSDLDVKIVKYSDYASEKKFLEYKAGILGAYTQDKHFRAHCHSQTYRNLQPVINQMGVKSKNSPLVKRFAEYLLLELSLKLYVANENVADIEYAPYCEMGIIESIYAGKYQLLRPFCQRQLQFIIINT